MGRPPKYPKLGSGKRFEEVEELIAKNRPIENPAAIAASIGDKKKSKWRSPWKSIS
jgi:hypothetical protein